MITDYLLLGIQKAPGSANFQVFHYKYFEKIILI